MCCKGRSKHMTYMNGLLGSNTGMDKFSLGELSAPSWITAVTVKVE